MATNEVGNERRGNDVTNALPGRAEGNDECEAAVATLSQPSTSGNYLADIQCYSPGPDGITYYDIRVSCGSDSWLVRRRYSDFLSLHTGLQQAWRQVLLPPMPPKSFFLIRLSPAFQRSRQEQLNSILQTALGADPMLLRLELLRNFLQNPATGEIRAASFSLPQPAPSDSPSRSNKPSNQPPASWEELPAEASLASNAPLAPTNAPLESNAPLASNAPTSAVADGGAGEMAEKAAAEQRAVEKAAAEKIATAEKAAAERAAAEKAAAERVAAERVAAENRAVEKAAAERVAAEKAAAEKRAAEKAAAERAAAEKAAAEKRAAEKAAAERAAAEKAAAEKRAAEKTAAERAAAEKAAAEKRAAERAAVEIAAADKAAAEKKAAERTAAEKTLKEPCKYGAECHNQDDEHRKRFDHPPTPCKYGENCRNYDDEHRKRFEHPSIPCKFGTGCLNYEDEHRKRYTHPSAPPPAAAPTLPSGLTASGTILPPGVGLEAPATVNPLKLPVCKYGAACYQKGLVHREEFFHPDAEQ